MREVSVTNDELLELAKPLMKLLLEKGDPHMKIIIDMTTVELLSGLMSSNRYYCQKCGKDLDVEKLNDYCDKCIKKE